MRLNGLVIQEALRAKPFVSIPWLQTTFGMGYSDARVLLTQLQKRGWVSRFPKGVEFRVQRRYLKLRRLEQSEVDDLIENFSEDCLNAMECACEEGATFEEMERAVKGETDTKNTIAYLKRRRLIWEYDGMYFVSVSKLTVSVLKDLVNSKKRASSLKRLMAESGDDDDDYTLLFKPLFE